MATLTQWIYCYLEYVSEIFFRFIWPFKSTIDDIENKAVLVTGCDTGFGHEIALDLNREGFTVFAGCLHPDKQSARSLLVSAKHPQRIHLIAIDVTNDLTVQLALEEVEKVLSSKDNLELWAVVNNAGVCPYGEIEWGSFDTIKSVLQVNALGSVLVTRTFLPLIRQSKGRVVNINSVACRIAVPGMIPYCMAKYASLAFTEGLRREMRKFGVKVASIEPFFYSTPMANCKNIQLQLEHTWRSTECEVKSAYGSKYYRRMLDQISKVALVTESNIQPVVDAVKDAVSNCYPKYHYLVANLFPRILCSLIGYVTPQETMENLFHALDIFNGRDTPFPETNGIK